jgi:hypothetical protein
MRYSRQAAFITLALLRIRVVALGREGESLCSWSKPRSEGKVQGEALVSRVKSGLQYDHMGIARDAAAFAHLREHVGSRRADWAAFLLVLQRQLVAVALVLIHKAAAHQAVVGLACRCFAVNACT